jgi:hemerythrin-like domain-containing protein
VILKLIESSEVLRMCEHCGCRGVEPIATLMDEHFVLLDLAGEVRRRIADGDRDGAVVRLARVQTALAPHVWVEENGLFAAMRESGDFVEYVEELERDHLDIDGTLADLDPDDPAWSKRVIATLDLLEEHINKENVGLFPAAVVSLGARGWETVSAAAHQRHQEVCHH